MQRVLELHREGHFNATYIGHPETYGARQHSPSHWCVIKRILDGRRQLIIADGGLKIAQRAYGENCAQSVLLCVDKPEASAGEYFVVGEQPLYTERQRIELICNVLNVEVELVDMPYPLARSAHYQWRSSPAHQVKDDSKIRSVLGYREIVDPSEAQVRTVQWIIDSAPQLSAEWEDQMEDTFDYAAEDELIQAWKEAFARLEAVPFATKVPAHAYRHPSRPNEPWHRPAATSDFARQWRALSYY